MGENLIVTTVTDCLRDEKKFVSLQAENDEGRQAEMTMPTRMYINKV
jgi:hypothetical protein